MITKNLSILDKLPLTCTRTGTCCHGKNVNLNPFELASLAKAKALKPEIFRNQYCELGGIRLRFDGPSGWKDLPACSQYQDGIGCTVHMGRPLACRLYPLGRQKQGDKTNYIFQGNAFPCLQGCAEVIHLPHMSVAEYIKGQSAVPFETAQDEYLEVMQNLADIAFVLLLETGLSESGDSKTLQLWREMGNENPEQLYLRIGAIWMNRLMLPALDIDLSNPSEFARQHNELLQSKAQETFGTLTTLQEWHEASCLLMGLALHLSRGLGADPKEMADHWINIAKEHDAIE